MRHHDCNTKAIMYQQTGNIKLNEIKFRKPKWNLTFIIKYLVRGRALELIKRCVIF